MNPLLHNPCFFICPITSQKIIVQTFTFPITNTDFKVFPKITNTMSLVDYSLFSWVVVIYSQHVSSFLEAHHQEIILPVQSDFWYIVFAVALPFSYVFCSRPGAEHVLYSANSNCSRNEEVSWKTLMPSTAAHQTLFLQAGKTVFYLCTFSHIAW